MQLNPARGRKLEQSGCKVDNVQVYAAQPREGTETRPRRCRAHLPSHWFMQLNPARGRKLAELPPGLVGSPLGLCSSTPRGDGNKTALDFL